MELLFVVDTTRRGGSFFIHQGAAGGAASLPGPSAVLVKQLKTGSCHAELVELPAPGEPGLAFVSLHAFLH